jgi:hypothetical protein
MKEKSYLCIKGSNVNTISYAIAIITSLALTSTILFPIVSAQETQIDLTAPEASTPYGGEKRGTLLISTQDNNLNLQAEIDVAAPQDRVYEGWLEDASGSGYKLSLGEFDNNELNFTQKMVNPYTYSQFVITEEPNDDVDPLGSDVAAGAKLESPFGQ